MENLKRLRIEKNLSQQKLAELLHVSQQSIHKYENNLASPDLETLKRMANFFNTSVDYLVGQTDVNHRIEQLTDTMLNDDELHLIEYYRKLSAKQKSAIKTVIDSYKN